jgi:hypothetical protein
VPANQLATLFFNKVIDLAQLCVAVKDTLHGMASGSITLVLVRFRRKPMLRLNNSCKPTAAGRQCVGRLGCDEQVGAK